MAGVVVIILLQSQLDADIFTADFPVVRAVLLNLLAYGLWAALGIGLGFITRSRVVAMLIGLAIFAIDTQFKFGIANTLEFLVYGSEVDSWMSSAIVGLPRTSTEAMTTTLSKYQGTPQHWWIGATILIAYAAASVALGYKSSNRRDIIR